MPACSRRVAERVEEAEQQAAVDLTLVRAVGVAEQRQRARPRAMMACQRPTISSSASSQVIGAKRPSPLAPARRSGVAMRSGE